MNKCPVHRKTLKIGVFMHFSNIDRYSLQPGQWVIFYHEENKVSREFAGPFKVIHRSDDGMLDKCRCNLMDIEGQLLDYCPRINMLDLTKLPFGYKVKAVSKEDIAKQLGEKIEGVRKSALDHLKKLSQSKYFEIGFNPNDKI